MFTGYSDKTVEFIWGIRFNNEREWFLAHKQEYLDHLYDPTAALAKQVHAAIAEAYPALAMEVHVSRIYRDARRLHGNGPYKDNLWFTLRHSGREWTEAPCFYFEVGPDGYMYGMGCYAAAPRMMEAFRADMDGHPEKMRALASTFAKQTEFAIEGEEYKRKRPCAVPLFEPWYNRKNLDLGVRKPFDETAFSPALADKMIEGFHFLIPYYKYFFELCQHLPD